MAGWRRIRGGVALLLASALLIATAETAGADCALIETTILALPSTDGQVDRPFAAPGDTVTVSSDSACKPQADAPHFSPIAANNQITLIFTPPTGVIPPNVAPFAASAVLNCGTQRCFAVEFQIPDTTGLAGAFPLTGPARIEVRNNAAGGALVAVIDDLLEPTKGCNPENRSPNLFRKFTVLPPRNSYAAGTGVTVRATVDGSGSLLVPLDYSAVLASPIGSGSGTVRLLKITADLPNGLSAGNGLAGADGSVIRPPRFGRFVRAFALNGRPIPPLLKVAASQPLSAGGVDYGDGIVGSVDFVDSVLRIAKVAENPASPGTPLQIFALDGEQGQPGLTLQGGVGPVLLTGLSLEAGAAAPLNSVAGSRNLAVVARDERLEQALGSGNQNGDSDFDDRVIHFVDLDSNTDVSTGMAVQEADGKAIYVSEGTRVALLQSENHQNYTDFTGDVDTFDGIFRVWTSDGSHPFCGGSACELTAGQGSFAGHPIAVMRGSGRPTAMAISGIADPSRYVFFARSEPGEASYLTLRLSASVLGGQTTGSSWNSTVSTSGRFVVFTSDDASIADPGPVTVPGVQQIYMRDGFLGSNRLISATVFRGIVGGNGASDNASVSRDGSYVAFDSFSTDLAPGDSEGQRDVFVWTTASATTLRASAGGDGASSNPRVADDGSGLVFQSIATNLVGGDSNSLADVFWFDSGGNERVSLTTYGGQANGASTNPAVSGDGTFVAFQSLANNLAAEADGNATSDIYLRDRSQGTTERISVGNAGAQANGASTNPDVSGDGRYVVFASSASNLLPPGATLNNPTQCYVRDRVSETTTLVSATLGQQGANAPCLNPSIDGTGRYVSFASAANNLDPDASTSSMRIYLHDRVLGHSNAGSGDGAAGTATAGPTGTRSKVGVGQQGILVFDTIATDLGTLDTNGTQDVYATLVQTSPSFNSGGPVPDTDNFDAVLFVYDTVNRTFTNTELPVAPARPFGDVAVAGGRAAVAPAGPGYSPGYIWDQEAGGVLRSMGGGGVHPFRVALSETTFCATDIVTGTLHVGDPSTGASQNTGIAVPLGAPAANVLVTEYSWLPNSTNKGDSVMGVQYLSPTTFDLEEVRMLMGTSEFSPITGDFHVVEFNAGLGDATGTIIATVPSVALLHRFPSDFTAQAVRIDLSSFDLVLQAGVAYGFVWSNPSTGGLRTQGTEFFADPRLRGLYVGSILGSDASFSSVPTNQLIPFQLLGAGVGQDLSPPVQAVGDRCVVAGSDGTLRFATRTGGSHAVTNTGVSARDFQVGEEGVAFRTCEADVALDLNGDSIVDDCVMRFWRFDTAPNLVDTQHVAVPCTFPGCDPFFEPYRVGPGIVSFVTSEPKEAGVAGAPPVGVTCLRTSPYGVCDKTGDEDGEDVAIEIYNIASRRSQVFPVSAKNPPRVDPFPKVVSGGTDNVLVIQLPAEVLGARYSSLAPDQLITVLVGDPDGDGVFEADGNTDSRTAVVDKCREVENVDQVDQDGDGLGAGCDFTRTTSLANDDPNTASEPAEIPGGELCDLNGSGLITRPEVDQIWADRGTPISQPEDHLLPLDTIPDPTDDRDRDGDGQITAVDFRLCLADCSAQANGCPLTEASAPPAAGGFKPGCGLLGIEALLVLLPWAWSRRRVGLKRENC